MHQQHYDHELFERMMKHRVFQRVFLHISLSLIHSIMDHSIHKNDQRPKENKKLPKLFSMKEKYILPIQDQQPTTILH
jgi:hypothetical protein